MYQRQRKDPRTKEEVLDRVLAYDFNGDIRDIGAETARLVRIGPNKLLLHFPVSGRTYELSVRLPRKEQRPARVAPETPTFAQKEGEQYLSPEQAREIAGRPSRKVRTGRARRASPAA